MHGTGQLVDSLCSLVEIDGIRLQVVENTNYLLYK